MIPSGGLGEISATVAGSDSFKRLVEIVCRNPGEDSSLVSFRTIRIIVTTMTTLCRTVVAFAKHSRRTKSPELRLAGELPVTILTAPFD
jgi:hypothetical protein